MWFLSPWLKCYTLLSSLHQHQNLQCRILHNTSFSPRTITVINLVAINRKYSSAHDVLLSFCVCVYNTTGKRRKRMEMKGPPPCEGLGMAVWTCHFLKEQSQPFRDKRKSSVLELLHERISSKIKRSTDNIQTTSKFSNSLLFIIGLLRWKIWSISYFGMLLISLFKWQRMWDLPGGHQ